MDENCMIYIIGPHWLAAWGVCVQQKDTDTCYLNNSTTLHAVLMSACHLCVSSMMSVTCLFSPAFFLPTCVFQRAADSSHGLARRVGVVFWSPRVSGGPGDAASRSPRVKGENSENRAFWSAREDLPAPFCMLEFGQGMEGVGLRICENSEGKEKKKKDQCKWGQMTDIYCWRELR